MNAGFLDHARATAPSNVKFVVADAYGSNLPAGTFDLVHMRFVASTSGAPERLLQEAETSRATGRHSCFARARYRDPQLLPATSQLGQVEGSVVWSIQWRWS
jgi:Methylase involved in ubiquinone/menaquinone biosynthesis